MAGGAARKRRAKGGGGKGGAQSEGGGADFLELNSWVDFSNVSEMERFTSALEDCLRGWGLEDCSFKGPDPGRLQRARQEREREREGRGRAVGGVVVGDVDLRETRTSGWVFLFLTSSTFTRLRASSLLTFLSLSLSCSSKAAQALQEHVRARPTLRRRATCVGTGQRPAVPRRAGDTRLGL